MTAGSWDERSGATGRFKEGSPAPVPTGRPGEAPGRALDCLRHRPRASPAGHPRPRCALSQKTSVRFPASSGLFPAAAAASGPTCTQQLANPFWRLRGTWGTGAESDRTETLAFCWLSTGDCPPFLDGTWDSWASKATCFIRSARRVSRANLLARWSLI